MTREVKVGSKKYGRQLGLGDSDYGTDRKAPAKFNGFRIMNQV